MYVSWSLSLQESLLNGPLSPPCVFPAQCSGHSSGPWAEFVRVDVPLPSSRLGRLELRKERGLTGFAHRHHAAFVHQKTISSLLIVCKNVPKLEFSLRRGPSINVLSSRYTLRESCTINSTIYSCWSLMLHCRGVDKWEIPAFHKVQMGLAADVGQTDI